MVSRGQFQRSRQPIRSSYPSYQNITLRLAHSQLSNLFSRWVQTPLKWKTAWVSDRSVFSSVIHKIAQRLLRGSTKIKDNVCVGDTTHLTSIIFSIPAQGLQKRISGGKQPLYSRFQLLKSQNDKVSHSERASNFKKWWWLGSQNSWVRLLTKKIRPMVIAVQILKVFGADRDGEEFLFVS